MGFLSGLIPLAITAGLDVLSMVMNRSAPRSAEKLKNKSVNSDALGQAFPRCRGTVRLQGKLIQSPNNLVEVTHKTVSGGFLGFGQSSFYFYSYTGYPVFAFGKKLGGGPAYNFLRIWADGKLIYNAKVTGATITGTVTLAAGTPSVAAGTTLATIDTGAASSVNLPAGTDFTFAAEPNVLYTVQQNFVLGASSSGQLSFWPPVDIDLPGGGAISIPGLSAPFYDQQWFETWAQMEAMQGVAHVSHTTGANTQADLPGSIYFHLGTDTELADSILAKFTGAAVQPGYRGLPNVFFNRLKLTQGGSNHIPNITAEIAFDNPAFQYPIVGPIAGVSLTTNTGVDPDNYLLPYTAGGGQRLPYVFCVCTTGSTTTVYRVNTQTNLLEATGTIPDRIFSIADNFTCDEDGFIYFVGQVNTVGGGITAGTLYKFDGLAMQVVDTAPALGFVHLVCTYDTFTFDQQGRPVIKKMLALTGDTTVQVFDRTLPFIAGSVASTTIASGHIRGLTANDNGHIWCSIDASIFELDGTFGPWIPNLASPGQFLQVPPSLAIEQNFTLVIMGVTFFGGGLFYALDDNSLILFDGSGYAVHIDCTTGVILGYVASTFGGSLNLYPDFGTYVDAGNGRGFYRISLSNFATGGTPIQTNYLLDNWFSGAPTSATAIGNYDAASHSVWINVGGALYRIYLDRALSSGVGLDSIVASILTEAGYASSQYDVTELGTIGVDGIELDQESYEDSLKHLSEIYLFDWAEIDGKLVFTLRSDISTVTILEEDLGALDQPDKYEPRLEESVQDELDTPQSVWLKYYDETKQLQQATQYDSRIIQPYATSLAGNRTVTNTRQQLVVTTPITGTPTQMKQQAEMMLADQWVRRPKFQFKLGPKYLQLDPSDKLLFVYKGVLLDMNLIEGDRGAGLGLEFHGEGHDSGIYASVAASGSGLGGVPVTGTPPPTSTAGATYAISPLYPLSQPNATEVDVASFIATFSNGARTTYNQRSGGSGLTIADPGLGNTQLYFVTIYDPTFVGDTPGMTNLAPFIGTTLSSVNYGQPGYIYAGSIIATHTGIGASVGAGGTGTGTMPPPGSTGGSVPVGVIQISLAPSAPGNFQVAHGQASAPALVTIEMTSGGEIWFQPARYDGTNIYLVASDAGVTARAIIWSVAADDEIAITSSAAGNITIPHSVGSTPALVLLQIDSAGDIWLQSPAADASNIYVTASDSGVSGFIQAFSAIPNLVVSQFVELALTPSAPGNFSVAHGLGRVPRLVVIRMTSSGAIWEQSVSADATNINLVASDSGITGIAEVWT